MRNKTAFFFSVSTVLCACFLSKPFRHSSFTYVQNGQQATLPLVVPKGYLKKEINDTAGVTLQTFYYPGGALLYAAYLADTTVEIGGFDKSLHQPLYHRLGGLVYKGQDSKELYYREISQGHLRFGYRLVPEDWEWRFDSATNFASLQKR